MTLHSQALLEFVLIRVPSWLIHSFCSNLLSSPAYHLCSCLLSLVPFHSLCLSAFVAMSQLCKTNPIPKSPKPTQPLMPQRITPLFRPAPPKKTNPNQTQSIAAKPLAKPEQTHAHAPKQSGIQPAIRNTKYDIPHPTYEITTCRTRISK